MGSRSAGQILFARWYVLLVGAVLSLVVGALAFQLTPMQYKSTGTAVLVQPKQPGIYTANPLMTFNASVATNALILVESLNSAAVATQMGVDPSQKGPDRYTVKNAGAADAMALGAQPFLTASVQCQLPVTCVNIVNGLMETAGQELKDRQTSLRVVPRNLIKLQTIVDATPPEPIMTGKVRALGLVAVTGAILTLLCAFTLDRFITRRQAGKAARSESERTAPEPAQGPPRYPDTEVNALTHSRNNATNGSEKVLAGNGPLRF